MKYVTRPQPPKMWSVSKGGWRVTDWEEIDVSETARTAHVEERPEFEDTGLLDAEGNRLYRQRDPIGFRPR